ncbi:porin [sulfur-oxidizing endosymbiont of Gigantopelta aegis]|uniref:porin n=1 Tax=sulfur-oxidizing endosymbiont of Gigantopelta aegis TaxID=2794934 RepID=UPI0018DDF96D|nr:porin [sulfur-oxidizing endosymbiont of Gigantopelta aegis]
MKKLIAAAVAAAVIAPAMAIAAGPTLYGKIHTSIDYLDNNTSNNEGTKYKEWAMSSNSSRIGVKGSEDLGNGMKVGYLIEWGVSMDGNKGGKDMSLRNRAITLSGDWGTALAGRWDSPMKTFGRKIDLFNDQVGNTRSIITSVGLAKNGTINNRNGTINNRASNVVAYVTPNMNGFSSTIAYVIDAGTGVNLSGDDSDASAWSFNAIYKNGPLMAGVAYVDYNEDGRVPTGGARPADRDNSSAWRVGGTYKFGDLKVAASYVDMESQNFTKDIDPSIWTLGAAYTMGNNTIKMQLVDRDDSGLKTCNGGNSAANSGALKCKDGATMWSVGLDHKMSKRTTVYAAYSDIDNNKNSISTPWTNSGHDGSANSPSIGNDADAFSVGIIHKF